jgi:hypothetical protein
MTHKFRFCVLAFSCLIAASCKPVDKRVGSYNAPVTMAGDVTGTTTASVVSSIAGSTPINVTPATLQWLSTTVAPTLTQASESTATKGADMTLAPQNSTHATDQGGGNLAVTLEAPTGAGVEADLILNRGAALAAQLGPMPGAGSTKSVLCLAPGTACDSTHYTLQSTSSAVIANAPLGGSIEFRFGGATAGGVFFSSASFLPEADNGLSIGSAADRVSDVESYTGSFAGQVSGGNNLPFAWKNSATQAVTASTVSLSNAQIVTPVIPLNGTVNASNCTITVPNTIGGHWYFDFTSVTFGGHNVIFTTGSGTSATISAASMLTGEFLVTCVVVASNVVSCGGG